MPDHMVEHVGAGVRALLGEIARLLRLGVKDVAAFGERLVKGGQRDVEPLACAPFRFLQPFPGGFKIPTQLDNIVNHLTEVPYISNIVIGLDRADEEQYRYALKYFSRLPQQHAVLWNDGPRMQAVHNRLGQASLAPEEPGKGRNVWYCIGYVLGARNSSVVALHDCDIVTYSREMLARLVYPVTNPAFPYVFAKGYYPRIADGSLNGRVTRLLVTPLLLALVWRSRQGD